MKGLMGCCCSPSGAWVCAISGVDCSVPTVGLTANWRYYANYAQTAIGSVQLSLTYCSDQVGFSISSVGGGEIGSYSGFWYSEPFIWNDEEYPYYEDFFTQASRMFFGCLDRQNNTPLTPTVVSFGAINNDPIGNPKSNAELIAEVEAMWSGCGFNSVNVVGGVIAIGLNSTYDQSCDPLDLVFGGITGDGVDITT
jgi:hypothetical protein